MVDTASLARRARTSEDGEAYVPTAKEADYRIGAGARSCSGRDPDFFVEVVLDLFPGRPGVDPEYLADRAALLERLRRRAYSLSCDDAGVVTCERTVNRTGLSEEARAVAELLRSPPRRPRPRPRP